MEIVTTMKSAHIRRIDRASTRRVRKMVQDAMTGACASVRAQGALPVSSVNDLSMHSIGPWVGTFAKCLARAAKREGISVVGGEMAQMPDSYTTGYVGIVVSVVGLKITDDPESYSMLQARALKPEPEKPNDDRRAC